MSKTFKIVLIVIIAIFAIYFANFYRSSFSLYGITSKVSKLFCDITKGEWVSSGCGFARCEMECIHKYSDSGKICTNSKQCKGMCVTQQKLDEYWDSESKTMKDCTEISSRQYKCPSNPVAVCQSAQLRCTESVWEYNDGILQKHSRTCAGG